MASGFKSRLLLHLWLPPAIAVNRLRIAARDRGQLRFEVELGPVEPPGLPK
jgi:hypothetical protein